ncbi:hypothetical protein J6590_069621 [Homalodisca vitripennis]|nr:hypothetical protein J6590_069621 [Homalodisca vitripennis]
MKDMEQVSTSESSSPEYPSTTRPLIPCLLKGIVEDRVKKDEWGKVVDDLLTELNKKRRGSRVPRYKRSYRETGRGCCTSVISCPVSGLLRKIRSNQQKRF